MDWKAVVGAAGVPGVEEPVGMLLTPDSPENQVEGRGRTLAALM
jgi:hypothetical protein